LSHSVSAALAAARTLGLDRLDAQVLLAHALQRPRSWLLAHDQAALTMLQRMAFDAACRRRADGEPLAYLLGEREFYGLVLQVSPAVLVPRPDTETLVDWALQLLASQPQPQPQVADLGTGSGAVALALKHGRPQAAVCAVDLSADALAVAQCNARRLGLDVEWRLGDWWQPLLGRRFDLVVSNPPYIATDDPHLPALRHEPALALVAGSDGLDALHRIVQGAPAQLRHGGWLLLEHGHEQATAVCRLLAQAGFDEVQTRADLAGRPRCSGGRLM
jgi:release factor glutamine methyltransferase